MPGQVGAVIGSKDRSVGWYDPPITTVEGPIRDLLENYSHIPADDVVSRITETVSSPSFAPLLSPCPIPIPPPPPSTITANYPFQ